MQRHLQLQSSLQLFDLAFVITKFSFCGSLFKCILAWERGISKRQYLERNCSSPCNLSFAIQIIQWYEKMFSLLLLSKSKFLNHVALVSSCSTHVAVVLHSYYTRVALVSLVLQSCHSCRTCVALVSFVSHSYCSCLVAK